MAQVPNIITFDIAQFEDQADWIEKLFFPLNQVLKSITGAFANQVTFRDNLKAQVKQIEIKVPGVLADAFPVKYRSVDFNGRDITPIGLQLWKVEEIADSPQIITAALWPDWSFAEGQVSINNIAGLSLNTRYRATIATFAG